MNPSRTLNANWLPRYRRGFMVLFDGWGLLKRHPQLKKWIVLPLLLDFLALVFGAVWGISALGVWLDAALQALLPQSSGAIFALIYYLTWFFLGLGFFVFWTYLIIVVASLVAAPFNAILAEKVLSQVGVSVPEHRGLNSKIRFFVKMLGVSLIKTAGASVLAVLFFVLSFLPLLNLGAILGALTIVAFDCLDYSYEAMGLQIKERVQLFKRNWPEALGLATALSLTLLLPGLTVLLMPVAVVGASGLVGSQFSKESERPR